MTPIPLRGRVKSEEWGRSTHERKSPQRCTSASNYSQKSSPKAQKRGQGVLIRTPCPLFVLGLVFGPQSSARALASSMAFCWAAGGQSGPPSVAAGRGPIFLWSSGEVNSPCGNSPLRSEFTAQKRRALSAPTRTALQRAGPQSSARALASSIAFCWAAGGQSS